MRILIADQDQKLTTFVERGLRREGFAVDIARDGNTGLEMAIGGDYDAILLEVAIPGLGGYDLLSELRAKGKNVPVLITSLQHQEQDKIAGFKYGADDYIAKPFLLSEVVARIQAAVRRTTHAIKDKRHPSSLKAGKLNLDLRSKQLMLGGKPVHLTKLEFELLAYLMRRSGHIISQDIIRQHLGGVEEIFESNALAVHVRNLRRKLDRPGKKSTIRTVRGFGYGLQI